MKTGIFSLCLVSMIVFFTWAGCSREVEDRQVDEEFVVRTVKVAQKEISPTIHTSGVISTKTEMKLSFKTGGIVESIPVNEGMAVKKGRVLAKLDLSEIQAQVAQARGAYQKAERDLKRVERLHADNVATLQQLQDATTGLEVSTSNLEAAEFNLKHSTIYAPADGKILRKFVEENELVSPGMPVFLFGSTGKEWIVRTGVTDREVIQLQLGDSANVYFDAYPGVDFPARVSEIAELVDPMSGTYGVELRVDSGVYKLISGFVARAEIVSSERHLFHVIPIEALVEADGDSGFVYTLRENGKTVRKIPVRIGMLLGDEIAMTEGLEGVDLVITEGAPYLADGSEVRIADK